MDPEPRLGLVLEGSRRAHPDALGGNGRLRLVAHQVEDAGDRRREGHAGVPRAGAARRGIDSGGSTRAPRQRGARAAVRVAGDLLREARAVLEVAAGVRNKVASRLSVLLATSTVLVFCAACGSSES